VVEELDHCEKCHGCKVLHEEKIIDVAISPGSKTGNRIKFKGEGDQIVSVENLFPNMAKAIEILSRCRFLLSNSEKRFE
jgi:DnaJ-class molecular chaperone